MPGPDALEPKQIRVVRRAAHHRPQETSSGVLQRRMKAGQHDVLRTVPGGRDLVLGTPGGLPYVNLRFGRGTEDDVRLCIHRTVEQDSGPSSQGEGGWFSSPPTDAAWIPRVFRDLRRRWKIPACLDTTSYPISQQGTIPSRLPSPSPFAEEQSKRYRAIGYQPSSTEPEPEPEPEPERPSITRKPSRAERLLKWRKAECEHVEIGPGRAVRVAPPSCPGGWWRRPPFRSLRRGHPMLRASGRWAAWWAPGLRGGKGGFSANRDPQGVC
ncbi:unnamed protein product [Diplocarpon coronariae]